MSQHLGSIVVGAFTTVIAGGIRIWSEWRRNGLWGPRWLGFWESRLGEWAVKLAGIGLGPLPLEPGLAALLNYRVTIVCAGPHQVQGLQGNVLIELAPHWPLRRQGDDAFLGEVCRIREGGLDRIGGQRGIAVKDLLRREACGEVGQDHGNRNPCSAHACLAVTHGGIHGDMVLPAHFRLRFPGTVTKIVPTGISV